MFSGCPSVRACVHLVIRSVSTKSYEPVDGISPNFLVDDVVEATDELSRF